MDGEAQLNDLITLILGTTSLIVMSMAIIFFMLLFQKRLAKKQQAFREIESLLKKQELKTTYSLMEGREQERKIIAEDLHDSLGSILSTLRMYSDLLAEKELNPETKELAAKISALTDQTAQETRRLSHQLDAGALKHTGIKEPVTQLCLAIEEASKLKIKTTIDVEGNLNGELSINLYRMVQELFTNTMKHARATEVRLEITQINNEYISLIFEDNGVGFDIGQKKTSGIGLTNLLARVERFHGNMTVDSKPGHGTTTIIEIPIS